MTIDFSQIYICTYITQHMYSFAPLKHAFLSRLKMGNLCNTLPLLTYFYLSLSCYEITVHHITSKSMLLGRARMTTEFAELTQTNLFGLSLLNHGPTTNPN